MVWIKLIAQIFNVAFLVFVLYLLAEKRSFHDIEDILLFTALFLFPLFNLLALYGSKAESVKKYITQTLLIGMACWVLALTYQYASQLQFNRSILPTAEKILAKDGKMIAELLGRTPDSAEGISFRVEDTKGHTHFEGNTLVINSYYIGKRGANLERIIVGMLVGKDHNPRLPAAYHLMREGLDRFIYCKLGYDTLYPSYYPYVDSVYSSANFFNWLYERPDGKKTYYAVIKDMNAGVKPSNLDALIEEYYNAQRKKAEQHMQANKK